MPVTEKRNYEPILLHGNLYRVPIKSICFAEEAKDGFSFFNPRLIEGSKKGFSKEEMAELRESIRTNGLENPLSLRHRDGKLQLISGERRLRSLQKLIKDDADCFDHASGEWVQASILYELVEARIGEYDDETAWKLAVAANACAIGIGEAATIALVRQLRAAEYADKQIMAITCKSITWLKDTDLLNTLDKKTLVALAADQINRAVALDLANENLEDRFVLLEKAIDFATHRLSSVKKKLEKEIQASESKADMAKAQAVEANYRGEDDVAAQALEKAEILESKAEDKRQEIQNKNGAVRVTTKDLQKAKSNKKKAEGDSNGVQIALTKAKIKKFWLETVEKIIAAEGCNEEGEPHELDLEDAYLVQDLCLAIENGETDIVQILSTHLLEKDSR